MEWLILPAAVLLVPLIWLMATYNQLVGLKNRIRESWADVDTELKRRYDLIPNLVEAVRGYMGHEQKVLQEVVEARKVAVSTTGNARKQSSVENQLIHAMDRLFVTVENYPDLKASKNFMQLQTELVNTEDRIQAARRFYNANIRDNNNLVQSVPSNIVAKLFGFKEAEYFEIEQVHMRATPSADLK